MIEAVFVIGDIELFFFFPPQDMDMKDWYWKRHIFLSLQNKGGNSRKHSIDT